MYNYLRVTEQRFKCEHSNFATRDNYYAFVIRVDNIKKKEHDSSKHKVYVEDIFQKIIPSEWFRAWRYSRKYIKLFCISSNKKNINKNNSKIRFKNEHSLTFYANFHT